MPLLSYIIVAPLLSGILCLCMPQSRQRLAKALALGTAGLSLLFAVLLLKGMDPSTFAMQYCETADWIPSLGIRYQIGVDTLSAALIALTILINGLTLLWIASRTMAQRNRYLAAFLIMQGFVCGAFAALDAILFYSFWEASLIPLFLIIGIWGGDRRLYASLKFFLYTLFGSIFLLAAIVYLQHQSQSFNIIDFQAVALDFKSQSWLFLAFLLAFGIKLPIWPLHTWLPDAHVEAPTAGSMLLAAIVLKMGAYGFLRFLLPIVPDACRTFAPTMTVLALIAIIYSALLALAQSDLNNLVAYASISHMGFVTLGLFSTCLIAPLGPSLYPSLGLQGAVIQLFSHAFIAAALFLCVGILYERMHSRLIRDYGGVAHRMPLFASYFLLFVLANAGLPGTSGFVAEFFVVLNVFKANNTYAMLAVLSLVLSACYGLRVYKNTMWGSMKPAMQALKDIDRWDRVLLTVFALFVLGLGLYPGVFVDFMRSAIDHVGMQLLHSKIVSVL